MSTVPQLPIIAIINETTIVPDITASHITAALQTQVNRDFAPAWGLAARVLFYPDKTLVPSNAWVVALLDDADQSGALGYHDLTPTGYPLSKVFVKTSIQAKIAWSTTASHEVLEMLVDPYVDLVTIKQMSASGIVLYAYEVCDPVENDSYNIGGALVSNFVYPEWFEDYNGISNAHTKYDFLGKLSAPFTLDAGGYASILKISTSAHWIQIFGSNGSRTNMMTKNRVQKRANKL